MAAAATLTLENREPTLGLVSEGVVELRIDGEETQRIAAGASFALPTNRARATIVNASSEVPATVITFQLH